MLELPAVIRTAVEADARALAEVEFKAISGYVELHPQLNQHDFLFLNPDVNLHRIRRWQRALRPEWADTMYLVAELNSVVVGFIGFGTEDNKQLVTELNVTPAFQNRGIGSMLLEHVINLFNNRHLYLYVVEFNIRAIRFYNRHGFMINEGAERRFVALPSQKSMPLVELIKPACEVRRLRSTPRVELANLNS